MIVMMAFTTAATAQFDSKAIGMKQKTKRKFKRYKFAAMNGDYKTFGDGSTMITGGMDFAAAKLKRRGLLTNRLAIVHGLEPGVFTAYTNNAGNKSFVLTPRVGYVVGLDAALTKRINLGVEIVPSVYMANTFTTSEAGKATYRDFGVSRGRLALTASYKFRK